MKYVIIGNCAAGINALEAIREEDKSSPLTIISDENYPPYCRCLISYYLAGTKKEEDLFLRPPDFYERMEAEALLGARVIKVIPPERKIVLKNKKEIDFDKLLIATGGYPKSLGIEGEDKEGVFKFRTIDDAKGLLKFSSGSKKAIILGGGLIGLKAAYGLKSQGLEVEVIVKSDIIMSQVIDIKGAEILRKHLEKKGVCIQTGLGAEKIIGDKKVKGLVLDNGQELKCDIVVIGKGIKANIDLLKDSGVETQWGVLTNEYLETNIKDIFAAGDCCQSYDLASGESTINALWTNASLQGRIAGFNMTGKRIIYEGSLAENSVDFYGLSLISLGLRKVPKERRGEYQELIRINPEKPLYKKLILKDNRLVGVVLIGSLRNAGVYRLLIREKIDISSIRDSLLEDNFGFARIRDLVAEKREDFKSISIEGKYI